MRSRHIFPALHCARAILCKSTRYRQGCEGYDTNHDTIVRSSAPQHFGASRRCPARHGAPNAPTDFRLSGLEKIITKS